VNLAIATQINLTIMIHYEFPLIPTHQNLKRQIKKSTATWSECEALLEKTLRKHKVKHASVLSNAKKGLLKINDYECPDIKITVYIDHAYRSIYIDRFYSATQNFHMAVKVLDSYLSVYLLKCITVKKVQHES
jgi:hypothetical protein